MHRFAPAPVIAALTTIAIHVILVGYLFATISQSSTKGPQQRAVSVTLQHVDQKLVTPSDAAQYLQTSYKDDLQQVSKERATDIFQTPAPNQTYYFKADEITKKPEVIVDLPAEFLMPPIKGGPASQVKMTLYINEDGVVDNIALPPDQFSDNAAQLVMAAFKSMRFQPALIGNIAVPSALQIEVFSASSLSQ